MLNVLDQDVLVEILKTIHGQRSMTVTEIYIYLRSDQPTVSQHLRKLREAGFVTTTRKGKFICYTVNYKQPLPEETYESIRDWIKSFPQVAEQYINALEGKEAELLKEVKRSRCTDLPKLQSSFVEIKEEGIRSFWRKHKL